MSCEKKKWFSMRDVYGILMMGMLQYLFTWTWTFDKVQFLLDAYHQPEETWEHCMFKRFYVHVYYKALWQSDVQQKH